MKKLMIASLVFVLTACQADTQNTLANPPAKPTAKAATQATNAVSSPVKATALQHSVSEMGVAGLQFGQTLNKSALTQAGLKYPADANSSCYYVTLNPAKTSEGRPNFLLVSDNTLGMVTLNHNGNDVFSGVKVGDTVTRVLTAHEQMPTYAIDKYDDGSGNAYHLIFTLANGNQIDYTLTGGQKMPATTLKSSDWNADIKSLLTGKVKQISVGTPSAIALVEGCS